MEDRLNQSQQVRLLEELKKYPGILELDAKGMFFDDLSLQKDFVRYLKDHEIVLLNFFGESDILDEEGVGYELDKEIIERIANERSSRTSSEVK